MRAIFYDTETTGLPVFKEPSESENQPHIVQLAASLVDLETRKVIASIDLISRPDGWVIPQETIEIHGITNELAAEVGLSEFVVVNTFIELWKVADKRIAHNISFDDRIIRIALKRNDYGDEFADSFKAAPTECTLWQSMPICKVPNVGKGGFKKPKLSEAYAFFFKKPLENAHSARADVDACIAVYFAIQDHAKAA